MTIQLNTDHSITGSEKFKSVVAEQLTRELGHFTEHITRLEVHLADENGNKEGHSDKRCTIEARIEGRPSVAVTNHANTYEQAVSGAVHKLKSSLDTVFGRLRNHQHQS